MLTKGGGTHDGERRHLATGADRRPTAPLGPIIPVAEKSMERRCLLLLLGAASTLLLGGCDLGGGEDEDDEGEEGEDEDDD
jgi:hypothetical protein